jgi:hypothetical protein
MVSRSGPSPHSDRVPAHLLRFHASNHRVVPWSCRLARFR